MKSLHLVPGALVLLLICGCAGLKSRPVNSIAITSIEPAPPANLKFGERMLVHIHYTNTNSDPVIIFARPYAHGERTDDDYSNPSYNFNQGSGDTVGWFYFRSAARVDEVRVSMLTAKTKSLVTSTSRRISAAWK